MITLAGMMFDTARGCPAKMAIADRHHLQSCAHFFVCAGVSAKISQTLIMWSRSLPELIVSLHPCARIVIREHG